MNYILKIEDLHKSYSRKVISVDGSQTTEVNNIIDGLNLNLKQGVINCLVGGNGSGKTTLLNLIQNYISKDSGNIFFFYGEEYINFEKRKPYELHSFGLGASGRLFQSKLILKNLPIMDNMLIGADEKIDSPFASLFKGKQIRDKEKKLKEKVFTIWNSLLGEDNFLKEKENDLAGTLSYGQQRILAMSRLMMREYKLILLDEPTAGVAKGLIPKIAEIITKIRDNGTSVLLIEHNMDFIESIADEIYWIDSGKIRLHGNKDEMLNNSDFIKKFLSHA